MLMFIIQRLTDILQILRFTPWQCTWTGGTVIC